MNKSVTLIPARKRMGSTEQEEEKPKLKVAVYCRVSTDSDEQATSYETQVEHYTSFIKKNPGWEFAGVFADDGISGCNTKNRNEFNRMISECLARNINMIVTKSISRFARNTLDCLKYIRQLKEKNIPVFFEKKDFYTAKAPENAEFTELSGIVLVLGGRLNIFNIIIRLSILLNFYSDYYE